MVKKKIIEDAIELTKEIPATDEPKAVLTPLETHDEVELTPAPRIEYDILIDSDIDKLIRNVNKRIENGWKCEGGIQVSTWAYTKFYQTLTRWNVSPIDNLFDENEPDLYEDIIETN